MENLIVFAVLAVLAFPIISVVALFKGFGTRERVELLERRFTDLTARLARLEFVIQRLAASPAASAAAALSAAAPPLPETGPAPGETPTPLAASVPLEATMPSEATVPLEAIAPAEATAPSEAIASTASPPGASPPDATATPSRIAPPPAPRAARAPTAPPPPGPGLEERFGTRWVVWIGGLALALGGIFLVRYSIEQGLIGPGVRIALGALLAAALIVTGEWLRRQETQSGIVGLPAAHVPSILTAAGTTVAYATVYSAYALYDFLGPVAAFVLLGAVALATLAAALLHGASLAALGLVGAEVVPLLVSTGSPNYWALYGFLAVVTAAAFTLARVRLWRWLAVTAVVFGVLWVFPGIADGSGDAMWAHLMHVVLGFGLVASLIVAGFLFGPQAQDGRIDFVSSAALTAYLGAGAVMVLVHGHEAAAPLVFAALTAAAIGIAWRTEAAVGALPAAAILSMLVTAAWTVDWEFTHLIASGPGNGLTPEPSGADIALHTGVAGALAVLFAGAGYLAQGRYERAVAPICWSGSAVLAPLVILIALYYGIAGLDRSVPFATAALALAAWFATASEQLTRRPVRPGTPTAAALHAAGSAAALALTLTFTLEKGWLTVGLALMAPGIAWVAEKRPLPLLRYVAASVAALVIGRIIWEPRIVGTDLGDTPIFNWLLYGYGLPALAFWTAGYLLRRRGDDVPSRTMDAAAILFTVLFAGFEIRHAVNGGDIYASVGGLAEAGMQVAAGFAIAIGLEGLRLRTRNIVHNVGAVIVASLTLAGIVFRLFGFDNPLLTSEPVGGLFVNLILLGYGIPAVLAIVLALMARATRPLSYRIFTAGISILLALAYLTLEVMRIFHGPVLTDGNIGNAENYTFSAVWIGFGVVLLLVGVLLRSKPARLASAAVIALSIGKVFLADMAGLTGIWRALSFILLGLVLVGIGYLYQRLLFPPRPRLPAPPPDAGAVPAPEGA